MTRILKTRFGAPKPGQHGGMYECDPFYHFDACLLAAEGALRETIRSRLEKLRQK